MCMVKDHQVIVSYICSLISNPIMCLFWNTILFWIEATTKQEPKTIYKIFVYKPTIT